MVYHEEIIERHYKDNTELILALKRTVLRNVKGTITLNICAVWDSTDQHCMCRKTRTNRNIYVECDH